MEDGERGLRQKDKDREASQNGGEKERAGSCFVLRSALCWIPRGPRVAEGAASAWHPGLGAGAPRLLCGPEQRLTHPPCNGGGSGEYGACFFFPLCPWVGKRKISECP
ncbi:hypothetical protein GDO81_009466 [Engystomops pustulosus]|uniref:Uncharacterized protein n=1 Tax=Engystomops pustulosus TaxID=76066 RepID=A0AAV7BS85_ENGPU|nr:hypothetical protein GDO81_009466 [Engystomops pustulosus]